MKKKENKHQENAEQPKKEKPVLVLAVPLFANGRVEVGGYPENWSMEQVMDVLAAGMIRVAQHFRKESDDKNLGRIIQLNNREMANAKKRLLQ